MDIKKVIKCNLSLIFFFLNILMTFWPVFIWISPRFCLKNGSYRSLSVFFIKRIILLSTGPCTLSKYWDLCPSIRLLAAQFQNYLSLFFSISSLVTNNVTCHWKSGSQITYWTTLVQREDLKLSNGFAQCRQVIIGNFTKPLMKTSSENQVTTIFRREKVQSKTIQPSQNECKL